MNQNSGIIFYCGLSFMAGRCEAQNFKFINQMDTTVLSFEGDKCWRIIHQIKDTRINIDKDAAHHGDAI